MLPTYVALHDITDAEGFVGATITRFQRSSSVSLSHAEREELLLEGICILYELAERYEPHRNGYTQGGSFSGYAAQFLPRRLGDAWHASTPGHHRVSAGDGTRQWTYEPPPLSIDNDEMPVIVASNMAVGDVQNEMLLVETALATIEPWQRIGVRRMVHLAVDGYGWDEIAQKLNVSRDRLGEMRVRFAEAIAMAREELGEHIPT